MFSGVELVSDNMNYSEKYVLPSQFFDFSINRWCEERYDTEDMWRQFNPYEKQKNISGVQISDGEKGGRKEGVRTQHVIRQSG